MEGRGAAEGDAPRALATTPAEALSRAGGGPPCRTVAGTRGRTTAVLCGAPCHPPDRVSLLRSAASASAVIRSFRERAPAAAVRATPIALPITGIDADAPAMCTACAATVAVCA